MESDSLEKVWDDRCYSLENVKFKTVTNVNTQKLHYEFS